MAVVIAVIAAFSQLATETKPKKIEDAREKNISYREDRDHTRDEIISLLRDHLGKNITFPSSAFHKEASELLKAYDTKTEKHARALSDLMQVKKESKIVGFKHLNAFLGSLGLPVFIFCLAMVLYVVSIFLNREEYFPVAELVKLLSQVSFITSLTYIYWVFNPKQDIHQALYVIALLFASYVTSKIIIWTLKRNFFNSPYVVGYEKLKNALTRIFDFIIIDVNDKFITEEQKVDYVNSYNNEIDKISEIID